MAEIKSQPPLFDQPRRYRLPTRNAGRPPVSRPTSVPMPHTLMVEANCVAVEKGPSFTSTDTRSPGISTIRLHNAPLRRALDRPSPRVEVLYRQPAHGGRTAPPGSSTCPTLKSRGSKRLPKSAIHLARSLKEPQIAPIPNARFFARFLSLFRSGNPSFRASRRGSKRVA